MTYSRFIQFGSLFLILAQFILTITFTVKYWNVTYPHKDLIIDGHSYIKGAMGFAQGRGLEDLYHSPGYQAFLGLLVKISGSIESAIHLNKVILVILFYASVLMLWKGGQRWFSSQTSMLAAGILSSSLSFRYYTNMVAYEVLVAFLLLAWLLLITRDRCLETRLHDFADFLSSLILTFIIWIQIRYFLLVFIPFFLFFKLRSCPSVKSLDGPWRAICICSGIPICLVLLWSIFISIHQGHFIFGMEGSQFRFNIGNNPNATGISYPYPNVVEPSGWSFILSRPGHFLWLVWQRFLYLWGIKPDVWAIPPLSEGRPWFEFYEKIIACVLFFAGWLTAIFLEVRREILIHRVALHFTLLVVLLLPLLVFGSYRFVMPILPVVCLFQAYTLEIIVKTALARQKGYDTAL